MTGRIVITWLLTVLLWGCAPRSAREGGFDGDDPASKLYAITRAGKNQDRSAIPHLIDQLNSDDPAVRMMAIIALERIAGTRMGYNPYAPPATRHGAVEAWVQAYRVDHHNRSEPNRD